MTGIKKIIEHSEEIAKLKAPLLVENNIKSLKKNHFSIKTNLNKIQKKQSKTWEEIKRMESGKRKEWIKIKNNSKKEFEKIIEKEKPNN